MTCTKCMYNGACGASYCNGYHFVPIQEKYEDEETITEREE